MPALNFKKEFADAVESSEKTQTIRKVWKRPIKTGDRLYLFTGMRTKKCRLLRKVWCYGVVPITIDETIVCVDGAQYKGSVSMGYIAKKDGFDSVDAFLDFFRKQYGLPFEGVLIWWE